MVPSAFVSFSEIIGVGSVVDGVTAGAYKGGMVGVDVDEGLVVLLVVLQPWTSNNPDIATQCTPITTAAKTNVFFIASPLKLFELKTGFIFHISAILSSFFYTLFFTLLL
jgi:hypothetical protein